MWKNLLKVSYRKELINELVYHIGNILAFRNRLIILYGMIDECGERESMLFWILLRETNKYRFSYMIRVTDEA